MNNDNKSYFNPLIAALIGGIAGALVVYFSDEKRRKVVMDKFGEVFDEGEKKGYELKNEIDKSIQSGKKNLVKKMRQVEDKIA